MILKLFPLVFRCVAPEVPVPQILLGKPWVIEDNASEHEAKLVHLQSYCRIPVKDIFPNFDYMVNHAQRVLDLRVAHSQTVKLEEAGDKTNKGSQGSGNQSESLVSLGAAPATPVRGPPVTSPSEERPFKILRRSFGNAAGATSASRMS